MIAAALLLAQAAASAAPLPERFSILADPCARATDDGSKDVVVCGRRDTPSPRLPLPEVRGAPDHAVPSNPDMIAGGERGSAAAFVRECGAYGEDCYGSGAGSIMPVLVDGVTGLAHKMFAHKPDKRGRVVIDLDGPPPPIPPDALKP